MNSRTALFGALMVVGLVLSTGCKPKYPNCETDEQCQEGEFCVNNLCQQCRDNGDCPPGHECAEGACRQLPGYCTDSSQCSNGQVCRNNQCGPCISNGDCPSGLVCMQGVCGQAECETDDECPAGLVCVNYRCKVDENAAAASGPCEMEPVYFNFDSSELDGDMRNRIERNYDCYKDHGGGKLRIEGHCDPRGTTEYNMGLGDRRARIVGKVVSTLGVEKSDLQIVSKGEEEATGTDESTWAKDRKVLFK